MTWKDKRRKTDHHVMGMADSISQEKREVLNEQRWEMKYNNVINRVKST